MAEVIGGVVDATTVGFMILHGATFFKVETVVPTFLGVFDGEGRGVFVTFPLFGGAAVAIFPGQGFGILADVEAGVLISLGVVEGGSLSIFSVVGGAAFFGREVDASPCGCPVVKSSTTSNKIAYC